MVKPARIGTDATLSDRIPNRRRKRRVVNPVTDEIREVEIFDARPVMNRREEIITPENSTFRFLRMARIRLDAAGPGYEPAAIRLGPDDEAILYVNSGSALISAGGKTYHLGQGDVLYAGLGEDLTIETGGSCDVSEFRAGDCHTKHPVQLVRHTEIEGTELAADVGTRRPMSKRTVYKLVDQNVQACRLLFGDTYLEQRGAVGSYPPHFHGPDGAFGLGENAKEEIYHFRCESDIDGATAYVLQNCSKPEDDVDLYVQMFDEEAVNVTPGYHDTIAPPHVAFMFTWCLGSFKEGHRDWAEIFNKPGFEEEW